MSNYPISITSGTYEKRYHEYVRSLGSVEAVQKIGQALNIIAGMRGKDQVADTWEMQILFKGIKLSEVPEGLTGYSRACAARSYVDLRVAQYREMERTRSK